MKIVYSKITRENVREARFYKGLQNFDYGCFFAQYVVLRKMYDTTYCKVLGKVGEQICADGEND